MIIVAIGANLPAADGASPLATCEAALTALTGSGIRVVRSSSWYRTEPVGGPEQPWFVNGVAIARTGLGPEATLAALHRIETRFGRARLVADGPRTLDLDLVDYDGIIRPGPPGPVLPHPRAHERRFVLAPLAEIAPDWRHPVLGRTAAALLAGLPARPAAERLAKGARRRRSP